MPYIPHNKRRSYDGVRKIWLSEKLQINPHAHRAEELHSISTEDVMFAFDMGYRTALLQMRHELVNLLEKVEIPTSEPTPDELNNLREFINSDFNGGIRKIIKQKIDASFEGKTGLNQRDKERRQHFSQQVELEWWA
jgi:hypothetical protein